jgi:hypothetical protein
LTLVRLGMFLNGLAMTGKTRFDQYMAKAQEAQEQAEKARDPKSEEAWRRIAANYRDLAMIAQHSNRKRRS